MIRPVEPRDIPALTDIYNHYIIHTTVSFETEPVTVAEMTRRVEQISATHPYLVHETDGTVDGYCYAHPWKERAAYRGTLETTVYLADGSQHRGIGRALMERLIADCRAADARALIACITGENDASVALHRRLGFRQVARFEKVGLKFGRLLDVLDFELLL